MSAQQPNPNKLTISPYSPLLAELLYQQQIFKLSLEYPVTWTSGLVMPFYCDLRTLLGQMHWRNFVVQWLCSFVKEQLLPQLPQHPMAQQNPSLRPTVVAMATAALPWGAVLADRLGLNFCYLRSQPKEHGTKKLLEGSFNGDSPVILMDDLISTGKSILFGKNYLLEHYPQLNQENLVLLSIFNYGLEQFVSNNQPSPSSIYSLGHFKDLYLHLKTTEPHVAEQLHRQVDSIICMS